MTQSRYHLHTSESSSSEFLYSPRTSIEVLFCCLSLVLLAFASNSKEDNSCINIKESSILTICTNIRIDFLVRRIPDGCKIISKKYLGQALKVVLIESTAVNTSVESLR